MYRKSPFRFLFLLITTFGLRGSIPHPVLLAADFILESTVRELNSPNEPRDFIVLFHQEMAFETSRNAPHQVTVFDFQQENIWRLDQQQQTKQRLRLQDLLHLTREATQRATGLRPLIQFAAAPQFTSREWHAERAELVLEHPLLTYRARLDEHVDPRWVSRYREFADWSARLNTLGPGLPPGARIELNREIALRNAVPLEVTCCLASDADTRVELVSVHRYRPLSGSEERVRLSEFYSWMDRFPEAIWSPGQGSGSR